MGSLDERRCSRITPLVGVYLKQFFSGDMSEKGFFERIFLEVVVRTSLAVRRAFSFNLLTNVRQDDVSDIQ
jgi:hypothetical protein